MLRFAAEKNYKFAILEAVEAVNERQKLRLLDEDAGAVRLAEGQADCSVGARVQAAHRRHARGAVGAAHSGDARGGRVRAGLRSGSDDGGARHLRLEDHYAENSYAALNGADALAIVTEWNEFREPDFERMRKLLSSPIIFDGRNLYNPEQIRAHGFTYLSIGRP